MGHQKPPQDNGASRLSGQPLDLKEKNKASQNESSGSKAYGCTLEVNCYRMVLSPSRVYICLIPCRVACGVAQPLEDSLSAGEPSFPLPLRPPYRFLEPPSGEGFHPFLLPKDSRSSTFQSPSNVGNSASPDNISRSAVTRVAAVPLLRK